MSVRNIKKQVIIQVVIAFLISVISFFAGYKFGISKTNKKYSIENAKENQIQHENNIKIIRTEPDSAAVKRFRENFGTD